MVGFALWAVVYGALGALAGRSEDSQAVSAPATVVLTASYLFALFSMPAHPVLAPPAQAAAGEGLDATNQQRHAEEGQDKARARIPH